MIFNWHFAVLKFGGMGGVNPLYPQTCMTLCPAEVWSKNAFKKSFSGIELHLMKKIRENFPTFVYTLRLASLQFFHLAIQNSQCQTGLMSFLMLPIQH